MVLRVLVVCVYLLTSCSTIDKRTRLVDPTDLQVGDRITIELLEGARIEGSFESMGRDSMAIATASGTQRYATQSIAAVSRVTTVPGVKPALYTLTVIIVLFAVIGFGLSGLAPAST